MADTYLRPTLGYNTGSSQDLMQSLDCKYRTQNLSHLFKPLDTIHVQAGHSSCSRGVSPTTVRAAARCHQLANAPVPNVLNGKLVSLACTT